MQILEIQCSEQLLCQIPRQLSCGHWFYRGVRSHEHDLTPSIGRQSIFKNQQDQVKRSDYEKSLLKEFQARSRFITQCSPQDEWEWLALAQHHRMPTRLLDWSTSLLVALYFACEKELKFDGTLGDYNYDKCALYMAHCESVLPHKDVCENPLSCGALGLVATPHVTTRMSAQSGVFSIQRNPLSSFEEEYYDPSNKQFITKIVIPSEVREELFILLSRFGVRPGSIYPDLDGLSLEVRQKHEMGCSMRHDSLSLS